jgi:transcriptional regulator with XRE-family HTH domain
MNETAAHCGALRAEMARRGATQNEIAKALGITQQSVSRRLKGEVPITVSELKSIADYLGVHASVLLGDDSAPERVAS